MDNYTSFEQEMGSLNLVHLKNTSLARFTTMKIGGYARYLVVTSNSNDLYRLLLVVKKNKIPFIILGKGSNVIVSDKGYEGLVIINTSENWHLIGTANSEIAPPKIIPRFESDYSGFDPGNKSENSGKTNHITVRVESGVGVNYLMHALYKEGISGLEWFTGIPATVGGAIYMNMHGGEFFFGELVERAVLTDGLAQKTVTNNYFNFGYDWSILHQSGEIILTADLRLTKGNLASAMRLTQQWAIHKAKQPKRSAGCIFRNLSIEEKERLGLPTTSVGYLIDKVLNLKGKKIGDAIISEKHAAFIENLGLAKAADVYHLINLIKKKAKSELGIDLQEEIQLVGKF